MNIESAKEAIPRPRRLGLNPHVDYRWIILTITTIAQTSVSFVSQGVPALAPFIQAEFDLSKGKIGMFSTIANLGSMMVLIAAGRAVDAFGEKWVITVSGVLAGVSTILTSFMPTYQMAMLMLFIMGLWLACSTPAGSKAVMGWFPPEHRGVAMGLRQTGIPLGGMLSAFILPKIGFTYGWRPAMLFGGFLCIVGSLACWVWYRTPGPRGNPRERSTLTPVRALFTRNIILVSMMGITFTATQFIVVTYIQFFSREIVGLSPQVSAYLLVLAQFGGVTGRIFWGRLSDSVFRGRRRIVLQIAGGLMVLSLVCISAVRGPINVWLMVSIVAMLGLTALGSNGLYITLLSELSGPDDAGTAVGIGLSFTQIGIICGPFLFGSLVDLTGSYNLAFLLDAIVVFIGTMLLIWVRERAREQTTKEQTTQGRRRYSAEAL